MKTPVFICAAVAGFSLHGSLVLFDFENDDVCFAASNRATRVSVTNTFASSGVRSLMYSCGVWRETCMAVDLPSVMDFRPYDRLCIDVVNAGDRPDEMNVHLAAPGERVNLSYYSYSGMRSRHFAPVGKSCWTMSLSEWPKKSKPDKVARLYFFCQRPFGSKMYLDRIRLLKKGEVDIPARYGGEDESRIAEMERAARERKEAAWISAHKDFLARCASAGQNTEKILVGRASSMSQVRPYDPVSGRDVEAAARLNVRLARGEYENFQIIVVPAGIEGLKDVGVSVEGFLSESGSEFNATNVSCSVTGYVKTRGVASYSTSKRKIKNGKLVRSGVNPVPGWWSDPILSYLDRTDVAAGVAQSFWVRVHCPRGQAPGVYAGSLVVSAKGIDSVRLPFTVRVNRFEMPSASPLPLAITFNPVCSHWWWENGEEHARRVAANADPQAPVNIWRKRRMEWGDFLADYYITVNNLYYNMKRPDPDFDILARQNERGRAGMINLGYWDGYSDTPKGRGWFETNMIHRFRKAYDTAKRLGLTDLVYLYGADEAKPETADRVRRGADALKREFPGVPLMTTARDVKYGVDSPLSCIDWFTPLTSHYRLGQADKARAAGHKVWWYICDGPIGEWANAHIENDPIDIRSLMGAQSARMRPDGFLYWQISYWNSSRPITGGPFTEWDPRSYKGFNGEGAWTAVGPDGIPLPTVRLENFRDGLEDLAYVRLLERLLAAGADGEWADKAKAMVAVPQSVMISMQNFSSDPRDIDAWREAMADLIESAQKGD